MRRWVFTTLLLGLFMLAFPLAASAGWGNSPYDKSDCTYTKESNFLFCETIVNHETVKTEQIGIADDSCPSGTRLFQRTGTFVEPTLVFDGFAGTHAACEPKRVRERRAATRSGVLEGLHGHRSRLPLAPHQRS